MLELYPRVLGEPPECPCLQWGTTPEHRSVGSGVGQRLEDGGLAEKPAEVCGAGQNWGLSDSEPEFGMYWL